MKANELQINNPDNVKLAMEFRYFSLNIPDIEIADVDESEEQNIFDA
jgi:hypothetical protein